MHAQSLFSKPPTALPLVITVLHKEPSKFATAFYCCKMSQFISNNVTTAVSMKRNLIHSTSYLSKQSKQKLLFSDKTLNHFFTKYLQLNLFNLPRYITDVKKRAKRSTSQEKDKEQTWATYL